MIAKIDYKAHLLKEEWWNQQDADDRYANIGQLINMGEKYDELGISGLSRLMDEISLLTDAAENADESIDSIKLMTCLLYTSRCV